MRRPGWKEFLQQASQKYELHVYTMGTRAYAEQVCAVIDPDKKIFGNRILSRDESGSEYSNPLRAGVYLTRARFNPEESATPIPLRYLYGSYHRRPCRRMGVESKSRQSHPMYV